VTHDRHVAAACDRVIEIADGRIAEDVKVLGMSAEESCARLSPCYCRMRKTDTTSLNLTEVKAG
jgi:ABC-type transport system involved in cytochrome bd biosynthesis fused ATPase/permease subunit